MSRLLPAEGVGRSGIVGRPCGRATGGSRRLSAVMLGGLALITACFGDRERPGPSGPVTEPLLTAVLQAPPTGSNAVTSFDIDVQVWARDLLTEQLEGVGFMVRQLGGGGPPVDSAAVWFAPTNDTTHVFTFQVPDSFSTNTQLDVYGIAYGTGGVTRLSAPIHLVVVRCADTVPVMCAPPRGQGVHGVEIAPVD